MTIAPMAPAWPPVGGMAVIDNEISEVLQRKSDCRKGNLGGIVLRMPVTSKPT